MNCNILLMGLTGVGKSSLINYLAGEELAESGIAFGTGGLTRGIHPYKIDINGQHCMVYDTEGLETDDAHSKFWQNLIDKELFSASSDKPIGQWYHIVVYCVGVNGGRVQDIELQMIEKLLDAGYGVIIAFTKADLATNEDIQELENAINEYFEYNIALQFIPICSKKTRTSVLEGKEKLSEVIIESWGRSVINRLPHAVFDTVFDDIISWHNSYYGWIANQSIGLFGRSKNDVLDDVNEEIKKRINAFAQEIKERQNKKLKEVRSIYKMLNIVVDADTLMESNPTFSTKIQKLESAFVFAGSTGINLSKNMFVTSVALFSLALLPVLAIPVAVIGSLLNIGNGARKNAELLEAFDSQCRNILRLFLLQRDAFGYSLGVMQGYLSDYVELGICYLKGLGVEKNTDKTVELFNEVIGYINESEAGYENPRFEWYMGYMLYNSEEYGRANEWIQMAAEHGSPYAKRVLSGENINAIEKERDAELENEITGFLREIIGEE